jgi:hypothetical protein
MKDGTISTASCCDMRDTGEEPPDRDIRKEISEASKL